MISNTQSISDISSSSSSTSPSPSHSPQFISHRSLAVMPQEGQVMPQGQKGALFDLDGVIIDTEGIYSTFWSALGAKYGLDPDFAQRIKGVTLPQILIENFAKSEHTFILEKLKAFEEQMQYRIFPGVIEYLEHLRSMGIPAAIVTSSGDAKMAHLWQQLPHLKSYFQAIITDSMVTRSKPDPQAYLIGAEALGLNPRDCWVYEDSFNGLKAGRDAGAYVVALSTTNPSEALVPLADRVIGNLKELLLV